MSKIDLCTEPTSKLCLQLAKYSATFLLTFYFNHISIIELMNIEKEAGICNNYLNALDLKLELRTSIHVDNKIDPNQN